MKRLVLVVLASVAWSATGAEPYDSGGAGPSELLFRAMGDELKRTVERLRVEDLAQPYFVSYGVLESHTLELQGSFGALEAPREIRTRRLEVVVRAGSRKLDDSHFTGTADGRFGKREVKGRASGGVIRFLATYPGESVEYSIDHPKFKKVTGREKNLMEREHRYADLVLERKD